MPINKSNIVWDDSPKDVIWEDEQPKDNNIVWNEPELGFKPKYIKPTPESKPEVTEDGFFRGYYKWLHTPTKEATSVKDWLFRVIPKSVSGTAVGLAEFPYFAIKSFTDPLIGLTSDLIKGKQSGVAVRERGIEVGKAAWDIVDGMAKFFGEGIGVYGWDKMKRKWLSDPAGAAVALYPLAKGAKANLKMERPVSYSEFGAKSAKPIQRTMQKVYDWIDIEAPFIRAGAEKTGIAFKRFHSIKIAEQKRAIKTAKDMKEFRLDDAGGVEVTLKTPEMKPTLKPTKFKTTGDAVKYGRQATKENIESLKTIREEATNLSKKLQKEGKLQAAMDVGYKAQLYNESIQAAQGRKFVEKPQTPVEKAAQKASDYFNDASIRLKKSGVIKNPWPESQIIRNSHNIQDLKTQLQKAKSRESAVKLRTEITDLQNVNKQLRQTDPQYVHIPLGDWYKKIREAYGEQTGQNVFNRITTALHRGRFFKARKTADIGKFIDVLRQLKDPHGRPIFQPTDFDMRTIMASYAQKVGEMRGLAEIFNNAKAEGLVRKRKGSAPDGFGEAPLELELKYPELKNHYIHNAFGEQLMDFVTNSGASFELGRIMGYTKMLAFHNPIILPAYDLWQGTWSGSVNPLRPIKTAKNFYKGVKSFAKRDKAYWEASEAGAFSTPYTPPFQNFKADMMKTVHGKLVDRLANKLKRTVKNPLNLIDDIYRLEWNMAWGGDNAIRMMTYHYMKQKGFNTLDAGQMTSYFHGDYAKIAPGARKVLNKIFFTPSFKYAMGHVQANMIKSSVKVMKEALKLKKPEARDLMLAKGGVMLVAGSMAKDALFKHWGFEVEDRGLRYVKRVDTDEGEKELVVYWPDPNNVILRQAHKWTKWGDDPDKMSEFINKAKWDLHPLWSLGIQLAFNDRGGDDRLIYNPFDDDSKIALDIVHHSVSKIVSMVGAVERHVGTEGARSAYTVLQKDLGFIREKFLSAATLAYLRKPKEERIAWQMRKLERLFKRFTYDDMPKDDKTAQKRMDNFFKRIGEISEELNIEVNKPKQENIVWDNK